LDQAIENGYLGLNNGILDQAAILLSRRDHLTVIDCAAVEHRLIKPSQAMPFKILIAFSGIRQALVNTDYNRRVEECAQAAQILLRAVGRPQQEHRLGKLTDDEYIAHKHLLSGPPARRAAHFFSETQRVEQGIAAWMQGDLERFGKLMTESGHSSIHNYECGSPPIIDLYEILVKTEGCTGRALAAPGSEAVASPWQIRTPSSRPGKRFKRRMPGVIQTWRQTRRYWFAVRMTA
jgi:galacturonokinase